jgi:hypothetical protein
MFSMNKLLGKHLFSKADLIDAATGTPRTRMHAQMTDDG